MIESTSRRTVAVLLALTVLLSAAGPVLAAAPSVDSETTDTTTQSALNDGDTVATFNASSNVNISTLQASYDSSDPGIKIVDPDTGDVIKTVTNASNPDYFTATNASANYYNTTFSEADFAAVPMGADENKSVTLRLLNNSTLDNPDTTNITVYLNNTDERAVVFAGSSAESGDSGTSTELDVDNESRFLRDDLEQATVTHDSLAVSENTTVYVLYADGNASDAYDAADDNTPLAQWGEYSSGDAMWSQQVAIEDTHHVVFDSSAPDDVADDVTYATTESVDGYDAVAIELGDEYEDDDTVDVSATANDKYGVLDRFTLRNQAFDSFLAGFGL